MLRRLLGYAAYMFFAGAATSLLSFAVDAAGMISRPKESYGDYHTYLLVLTVGMSLCIYGVNGSIQRFGAGSTENQRRLVSLALRGFLALNGLGAAVAAGVFVFYGLRIALAFVALPWLVLFWWGRYILRSRLEPRFEARLLVVGSLSKTVCIGGFLWLTDSADAMIYGDALALVVAGVVTLAFIPGAFGAPILTLLREPVPPGFVRELVRFSVPLWTGGQVFAASQEIVGIYTVQVLGRGPMGALGGMRQLWNFAFKPMDFLGQASLPGLVAEHERRAELYRDVLRLCAFSFPLIGLVVAVLCPVLLGVMQIDEKYAEIPTMMLVMAIGVPANATQIVLSQYAIADGQPKFTLWSHVAAVVAIAATIVPFATWFGLPGVVLTNWVANLASTAVFVVAMWPDHGREMRSTVGLGLVSSLATALALAPSFVWRQEPEAWRLIGVALPIYLAVSALGGTIGLADLRAGAAAIRRGWTRFVRRGGSARP